MVARILCVAEKNSIAKAVAQHLGQHPRMANVQGTQYVKNYTFDYRFQSWGDSHVTFTSVSGHVFSTDFGAEYKNWQSRDAVELFHAPIHDFLTSDAKKLADNIQRHARQSQVLFIWTDCDREGENIGSEIRDLAMKVNPRIQVARARFSNVERTHVIEAARRPVALDENQASAIAARKELDLRIGAAFTRLQTLQLGSMVSHLRTGDHVLSYGPCQFPTLGFVVDRYWKVQKFVPETFWLLKVLHKKDGIDVRFNWRRNHLFDRMAVTILFERCLTAKYAKVTKMQTKPTSKWRPLPLTTVELQKMGSRFLQMDSKTSLKAAEELYTKGFISYPRTETDQFDKEIDLRALVGKQTQDRTWGQYAQRLVNGEFKTPRAGRNNDKAHPPIHPVNFVTGTTLTNEQRRVYELVTRRFLACCSDDAKGEATDVNIQYGVEEFHAHGLRVLARNYLDVYPYERWESSRQLPEFTVGETFVPTEANMTDGKTTAPEYMTEPELISLMDANGIGTDATIAEHISKIKGRQYVSAVPKPGRVRANAQADDGDGGQARRGASNNTEVFIPTRLGTALIEGYDKIGFETSLSKPFLRKDMELQVTAICEGTKTKREVVEQSIEQYEEVYRKTTQQINILKRSIREYVLDPQLEENGQP